MESTAHSVHSALRVSALSGRADWGEGPPLALPSCCARRGRTYGNLDCWMDFATDLVLNDSVEIPRLCAVTLQIHISILNHFSQYFRITHCDDFVTNGGISPPTTHMQELCRRTPQSPKVSATTSEDDVKGAREIARLNRNEPTENQSLCHLMRWTPPPNLPPRRSKNHPSICRRREGAATPSLSDGALLPRIHGGFSVFSGFGGSSISLH